MKKVLFSILLVLAIHFGYAQQSPYSLPLPAKWGVEKIPFPIQFAPVIPYKGNEEIRFTPGWGDSTSIEYWSYTFLWFIEGKPHITADTLQHHITAYFNGLYATNQKPTAPTPPPGFTSVHFKKINAAANDNETYEGSIATLNFLTGRSIKFNVRVHVRSFSAINRSGILFEISPQDYQHPVWSKLDSVVNGFRLTN